MKKLLYITATFARRSSYIAYEQGPYAAAAATTSSIVTAGRGGDQLIFDGPSYFSDAYLDLPNLYNDDLYPRPIVEFLPQPPPILEVNALPPAIAQPIIQPIIQPLIRPVPIRTNSGGGRNQYKTIIINNDSYNQSSNNDVTTTTTTTTTTTAATTTTTTLVTTVANALNSGLDSDLEAALGEAINSVLNQNVRSSLGGGSSPSSLRSAISGALGTGTNGTTPTIVFQPQFVFTTPNAMSMTAGSQGSVNFFQQQHPGQQNGSSQGWWCGMIPCNASNYFVPSLASYESEYKERDESSIFHNSAKPQVNGGGSLTISTQEIEFIDPSTGLSMFLPRRAHSTLSSN